VTDKVERGWEQQNNQYIETDAKHYKNAKVLDWYYFGTHIDQKTNFACEFGCSLRLHLTKAGAHFYTTLMINTLRTWHWLPQ
jgi:hypothetical protein